MNEVAYKLAELIRILRKCANNVELVSSIGNTIGVAPARKIEVTTPKGTIKTEKIGRAIEFITETCDSIPVSWYLYTDGMLIAEINLEEVDL